MAPNYTHAIILDFEATCDDKARPSPQEIIEFPSVLVALDTLDVADEFEAFVKPVHHPVLSEFCKSLTSISQADIDKAATFPDVFADHKTWLDGHGLTADNAFIVTCGDWDLGTMLPAQCPVSAPPVETLPPIYTKWQNIKAAYCQVRQKDKAPGMSGMLREMGLELVGRHHRGIDDCRNIAALYRELIRQGARPEATAHLPAAKHPPITIRLRLDDRIEETRLDTRRTKALVGLSGRLFKRKPKEFQRADGRTINGDDDLASLEPGEEIRLILA